MYRDGMLSRQKKVEFDTWMELGVHTSPAATPVGGMLIRHAALH
jgi:hypothetical protein